MTLEAPSNGCLTPPLGLCRKRIHLFAAVGHYLTSALWDIGLVEDRMKLDLLGHKLSDPFFAPCKSAIVSAFYIGVRGA